MWARIGGSRGELGREVGKEPANIDGLAEHARQSLDLGGVFVGDHGHLVAPVEDGPSPKPFSSWMRAISAVNSSTLRSGRRVDRSSV
jgi:hypothetical protein